MLWFTRNGGSDENVYIQMRSINKHQFRYMKKRKQFLKGRSVDTNKKKIFGV